MANEMAINILTYPCKGVKCVPKTENLKIQQVVAGVAVAVAVAEVEQKKQKIEKNTSIK